MTAMSSDDYAFLNRPEVLRGLFHPRPSYGPSGNVTGAVDVMIPLGDRVAVAGRFHVGAPLAPNILFFHGNGEIADDYDGLGPLYARAGINFLVTDYRGYGRSTGLPTVSRMMRDGHAVLEFSRQWLDGNGYRGAFIVMGRSLGSAPALDLIHRRRELVDGLIIESGFARTAPFLELLGVDAAGMGFTEEQGFRNLDKIRTWDKAALILHAEFDPIFPFSEGRALYDACPSRFKTLLKIPGAGHNDIFIRGMDAYMRAVKALCGEAAS